MSAITAKASRKMKKYAVLTREPRCFLGSFDFSWEQRKVVDLLIERNQQAPMSDEYPLMAFIANEGVAPKGERYDRSALVTDTVNKLYKKTEKGDFIYSSNNLETGSIGLNKYGKACISPVYSIFEPTGIADSDFLGRRLVRKDFINAMVKWRQGVIYGQWRIHESDFLKIEITVPSVEEQRKIGTYLDQLDHLITLHQRKCANLCSPSQVVFSLLFVTSTFSWEQRKVSELFRVTRGYVLAATQTETEKTDEKPYPVYSSQTKDKGLMGYYKDYLYEDAITWTTDGANAGTVNYRAGKFYCTNVCGVLLSNEVKANQMIAEALNNVAKGYVSYVGNPKLMNNVMADIVIQIPTHAEEREQLSSFFANLDHLITLHQRECISFTGRADRLILTANKKRTTSSWEQRKLGDIGKARSGVGFPDADQGGVTGVPFFKVSDMNLDGNENEMIVANNYVTAEQIADHRWSPITELPAIFFAKVGAAVMLNRKRLCRFPFLLDNNTMAYSLSPTKWDADFAKALFGTVDLTSLVQVGALPSYNAGDVESMGIYLPSLFEQEQIGAFFKLLDNLITLHQRQPFFIQPRIFL